MGRSTAGLCAAIPIRFPAEPFANTAGRAPGCAGGAGRFIHTMVRGLVALLVMVSLPASAGCAGPGGPRSVNRAGAPAPDVDPARAYKTLDQIEPTVTKPVGTADVKPLSERAARQITEADDLAREQRYTEAAIALERALRYDPDHPQIHRALSMLHWQAGNLERAKVHVARASEGNPNDAAVHYLNGRCEARGGNLAAALTAFRTALLCDNLADDPEVAALCHYHLAGALLQERYLEAALSQFTAFEATVSALPQGRSHPELIALVAATGGSAGEPKSQILEKLGRYGEAADALAPLAGAGGDAAVQLRYARLLLRAKRLNDALGAARDVQTDDDQLTELLLDIHTAAGHPERVVADLRERVAARPGDPRPVVSLCDMLVRLGRADEAQRELRAYLADHPDAHAVRVRLVDQLVEQSKWADSLAVCADGLERYPDQAAILERKIISLASNSQALDVLLAPSAVDESAATAYLRGIVAAAAGHWEQAAARLWESHRRNPTSIPCRVELANVYLHQYRYDEALKAAGRMEENTPEDARLELVLGRVYERLDDVDRAELHFKAATQLDHGDTEVMFDLATLYRHSNRGLQAERQLHVLLETDPDHEAARELLAFSYLGDRKRDVAIEQFEELTRRAKTPTTKARCQGLIDQLRARGPDPEAYRRVLREAIKRHGSDAATWIAVAESYHADEAPQERTEAFRHALAADPDNEEAVLGLVEACQRMLAFEEAVERLSALLPRRPNRHAWRIGLIELDLIVQDFDAALTLAEAGDKRDDLSDAWRRQYRLAIIDALQLTDRGNESLARLEQWAAAETEPAEWSTRLAAEYLRRGRNDEALAIYEALRETEPDRPELAWILAEALVAVGRPDRGFQSVLDGLANDPENENAVFRLARVMVQAKRYDDAAELIHNRLLQTSAREEYQDLLIGTLIQAERYDEALDRIERMIDDALALMRVVHDAPEDGADDEPPTPEELVRRPNEPLTLERLAERVGALRLSQATALILAKSYHAAEEQLTAWLEASREPNERYELLRRLALCRRAKGDEAEANEALTRALLLKPDDVTLNNDVAYGWIDQGIRLDEAEPMIRYAVARFPRQPAYLDTYGWLLYKKGDFANAKRWLTRAARAATDADAVILDHLGDACWPLGGHDEAIAHWTAAVGKAAERGEDDTVSADERRVSRMTPGKIEDAKAGHSPKIAPSGGEVGGGKTGG